MGGSRMAQQPLACGWGRARMAVGAGLLLAALAGCSLISLKSPERPLSPQDLNARILTRERSSQFVAEVGRCADDIAATETDSAVLDNALRWEIAAVAESRRAATRMTPMMSLVDTWALAAQMQAFVADGGAGGALFGAHQDTVRAISDRYAADAEALARRLIAPRDFADYRSFIAQYVRQHPLADLTFARPSIIELWSRDTGADPKLVDAFGTIPQAMADAADRMQIYSDTLPAQMMRRTELALRSSGYSRSDLQSSLRRLDERLERLSAVAESTPELVHEAEAQVRDSLHEVLEHFDASSKSATETLRSERGELFTDIRSERAALVAAVDEQRKAFAADAARIADRAVTTAGAEARRAARDILLLLTLLALVVLGLPFGAGYLLGRARRDAAHRPPGGP
jgi:hypothetical protein